QRLRKLTHRLPLVLDGDRRMQCNLAPFRSAINHQQQVANLGGLQRSALYARLVDQRRGIEQTVKIEVSAPAQVSAQLLGELLLQPYPCAVTRGRELHHPCVSKGRCGVSREQLAQR